MRVLRPHVLAGFVLLSRPWPFGGSEEETSTGHHIVRALQQPFEDGAAVTRACLECHTQAADQIHSSIHWTWYFKQPSTGQGLGKRFVVTPCAWPDG